MVLCDTAAWRRWLYLEFFIVNIMGALSQRPCTNDRGFIEDSSYFLGNDTKAYPVQYGDCSFAESLCNYTQLCTDIDAENWRQNGDHAESPGKNGLLDSFSVLVSPLLEIGHVTCLTFEYTQDPPGQLSVYLAASTSLLPVLPEELRYKQSFVNFATDLQNTTGKLLFRARSANIYDKVQLRGVKLQYGSCTMPACSFGSDYEPSNCSWSLNNWDITFHLKAPPETINAATRGYFARVVNTTLIGTMITSLVQPTGAHRGCLEFSFILDGPDLRLLVLILSLDGSRRELWAVSSNMSTILYTWQQARVPVTSPTAFTVIFENYPAYSNSGFIAVDSVKYTIMKECFVEPWDAHISNDDVISSSLSLSLSSSTQTMPETISSVLGLKISKPETTTTFLPSTWPRSEEDTTDYQEATFSQSNNDQKTPVIVGSVVAVVIVIVIACIVALVIIVIRKRRKKHQGGKNTSDDTPVAGIVNDLHNDSEDPLSGTTLVDIKDTQVFSKPDVDPCDVADDGLPGSTRSAVIDDCGHTPSPEDKARSCSTSQDSHKQSKEPSEIYSQVHKKKKETVDVYSQIHKRIKETGNKSLEQSMEARGFISPLHTPKIFELSDPHRPLAMANTEDEQEYNALNFEQHRQVGRSSPPREDSRQTYDHIHGDVVNDCPKVEHNRQAANMMVDTDYDHLGT